MSTSLILKEIDDESAGTHKIRLFIYLEKFKKQKKLFILGIVLIK